jgi:hypothetical protein
MQRSDRDSFPKPSVYLQTYSGRVAAVALRKIVFHFITRTRHLYMEPAGKYR